MVNPDICSCCEEIWNRDNLHSLKLGKHSLHLCPDCFKEYVKTIEKAYMDGQKNSSKRTRQ